MAQASNNSYDTIIVGGGLVGATVACGIAQHDHKVMVLDGGDRDFRASRGNFGLIWVQGKGADSPAYARWSGIAASRWAEFALELQEATGVDVGLQQTGGYDFCLTREEWDAREQEMRLVQTHTDGEFEYQMLDNEALRQRIPQVSQDVLGASYSASDGHVEPAIPAARFTPSHAGSRLRVPCWSAGGVDAAGKWSLRGQQQCTNLLL